MSLPIKDTEMKCRIQGVASAMHSFIGCMVLGQLLLQLVIISVARTLQSQEMSAAEGQKIAEMAICMHTTIYKM